MIHLINQVFNENMCLQNTASVGLVITGTERGAIRNIIFDFDAQLHQWKIETTVSK